MRNVIIAVAIVALISLWPARPPKPKWDGARYSCPAGYDVYADEHEAIAGEDFVHCVK